MFKKMLALMALALIAANVQAGRHNSIRSATVAANCGTENAPECYYTREFTKPAICDKQVSCIWSCPADCQTR